MPGRQAATLGRFLKPREHSWSINLWIEIIIEARNKSNCNTSLGSAIQAESDYAITRSYLVGGCVRSVERCSEGRPSCASVMNCIEAVKAFSSAKVPIGRS